MRPSSYTPDAAPLQKTSSGNTNVQTFTLPDGTSAVLIGVETNDARVTFDGTAPTSTVGVIYPKGVAPVLIPIHKDATIKFVANIASGNSIVTLIPLT